MSFQQIVVMGNLGGDPELRYTQAGKAVCNFNLAVNEGSKDKQVVTWFHIVAWDKTAELCGEYLKKGAQCLICGRMQERAWDDKDGGKRKSWELVASQVKFVGGKKEGERQPGRTKDYDFGPPPISDDDIPF